MGPAAPPLKQASLNIATIDVGTNTTLLLVASAPGSSSRDLEVLAERAEITRLGRGIGAGGRLEEAGVARTLAVLREYADLASEHGARVVAVGTEALRRAPNAADFLHPAAQILGTEVEVIDGAREAALTFRAAAESFPELGVAGPMIVVDIGGGSTEVIIAEGGRVLRTESLPLGSVRLTERHVRQDPPTPEERQAIEREIESTLGHLVFPPPGSASARTNLVGVAGTVTSLCAMVLELASYDATRVHGYQLPVAALDAQIRRLQAATQAEREAMVGLDPRRADVIFAGALILRAVARQAQAQLVRVSDRGVRWGLVYEALDAVGKSPP